MSFDILPTELLEAIFSHCGRDDQLAVGLVCHRWAIAVEPMLLQQSCLRVSYAVRRYNSYEQTRLIGREVLEGSSRRYSCLRVEWNDGEVGSRKMKVLEELLEVCQERFPVQRLFLRGTPDKSLAKFFEDRREWLENLTELHVELGSPYGGESTDDAVCELALPKLKLLSWREIETTDADPGTWEDRESSIFFDEWYAFALKVPELEQLKVRMNSKLVRIPLDSRLAEQDVCCLFLPSLELRTYPKLQNVEIEGLFELHQSHVNNCERFLHNMKVLSFVKCHSNVIKQICEKCPNLDELTVDEPLEGLLSFQISPVLSPSLEKFTFKSIYHSFARNDRAVFPKLRYIHLIDMCIGLFLGNVPLVAPQLQTFIAPQFDYNKLIMPHKEQIRTMAVEFESSERRELVPPPPNVTELFLRHKCDQLAALQDYLKFYPNLRRLTISGVDSSNPLDGSFLRSILPHLEYLHAHRFTIRLSDFQELSNLKSLILSKCTIQTEPNDDDQQELNLTALEYFRVELVKIDAAEESNQFPLRGNERQPPIELVSRAPDGRRVFSSANFRMELPPEFRHIVAAKPCLDDYVRIV